MAAQVIIYDLAGRIRIEGADVAAREIGKVHRAASSIKKGFKDLKEAGGHLQHAAMGVAMMGVGVAGALGKMAHGALEFEQKMAYVGALVGGKHTDEFKAFELEARRAGITTFASSTKAAEAIYAIKKAGFTTVETISALNPVLALSTLEEIKVGEAAHKAASMTRAFGLSATRTKDMVDAMAFVSKSTSASIKDLGAGMTYSATTARLLKLDYRDVLVMLGMLNNAGLKGSVAGTTLNAALLRLSGAAIRGKKYIKELDLSLVDSAGNTKSATVLLNDALLKYKTMDEKYGTIKATRKWMLALGLVGGKFPAMLHEMMAYEDLLPILTTGIKKETDAQRIHSFALQLAQRRYESTLGTVELMNNAINTFAVEISKANLFGGVFSDKLHKILGVMRLAAAAVGGYKIAKRVDIMGTFGLTEETATRVEKVVSGIKRGISEAISFVEKMYKKATEYVKKTGHGGNLEQIAATATKVLLALGAMGPVIFAAIPVVWTLTGAIGALFAATKSLSGPSTLIIAIVAGITALEGKISDTGGKSKGFFASLISGFRDGNSVAGSLLSTIVGITKELGVWGTLGAFAGLKGASHFVGKGLTAAASRTPGAAGLITGALGTELIRGLPVKVMNWPASLEIPGLGGGLGAAAAPGGTGVAAAAAAGASRFNLILGAVGSIVIGGTVGYIIGKSLDDAFGLTNKKSSQGLFSSIQDILPFAVPGGPALTAAGAPFGEGWHKWAPEIDKFFGTRERTGEENERIAKVHVLNTRAQIALEEFDKTIEMYKSGERMYGGEMITQESVRRRLREGLAGSAQAANAPTIIKKLTDISDQLIAPGTGESAAFTELERLNKQIKDVTEGGVIGSGIPVPYEIQAQKEKEIAEITAQRNKIAELLQAMRGEKKVIRFELYTILDGKQIASSAREVDLNNAARSGGRPDANTSNQSTTAPEAIMSE